VLVLPVGGGYVYWTEPIGNTVMRASIDGGGVTTMANGQKPDNVVVGNGVIFFGTEMDGKLWSTPADGGAPQQLWHSSVSVTAISVGTDGTTLVWTEVNNPNVWQCAANACAPTIVASPGGAPEFPVVFAGSVYWLDVSTGSVWKAHLAADAGIPPKAIGTGPLTPIGLAVDSTGVYWAAGSTVRKLVE
jgi:hypothetical protein